MLTEKIAKLENKLQVYEQQIDKLKESQRKSGQVVVDKYILEPTRALMKFINKGNTEKLETKAIDESKKLRK